MNGLWSSLILAGTYLLGAIPFGLLVGLARGVDIRILGSGNIGATNVGRALGKPAALFVFLLDMLKGFGPVFAVRVWLAPAIFAGLPGPSLGHQLLITGTAVAALIGHMFPVYLGFRGGKGAATGLGLLLAMNPGAGISAFGVWVAMLGVFGYVSLASMVAASSYPAWYLLAASLDARGMQGRWLYWSFLAVLCALVVFRHRSNLARILAGTEDRIGPFAQRQDAPQTGSSLPECRPR